MQILIGIGLYVSASQVIEKTIGLGSVLASVLAYVPAIWVVIGLTTLLVGVFPKWAGFVWIYMLFAMIVIYLGNLLGFPEWLNRFSAFYQVPLLPNEEVNWLTLSLLSIVGTVLSVSGFLGYNKRDI